jgi:hypothetical protein
LQSHKRFPLEACGKSGEANVAFTIDRTGKLISTAIVLRETKPLTNDDTNWLTGAGVMPMHSLARYDSAIAELRRQHPRLDWEGITEREGQWRRIARYWSEEK